MLKMMQLGYRNPKKIKYTINGLLQADRHLLVGLANSNLFWNYPSLWLYNSSILNPASASSASSSMTLSLRHSFSVMAYCKAVRSYLTIDYYGSETEVETLILLSLSCCLLICAGLIIFLTS